MCYAALMENKMAWERAKKKLTVKTSLSECNQAQCLSQRLGQKGLYFGAELLKYALFAQRTTSQSLRIRQTIQLPHTAPSTKKPPPKLVFLLPVIKTWVWMRASVSPGKITHTHSQQGGTSVVYSGPPRHLIGEKWFILTRSPDWLMSITDLGMFYTCQTVLTYFVCIMCAQSLHTYTYASLYMYVCEPSATSWLGLELREFGHQAKTTCQTCTRLAERQSEPSHHTNNTYTEAKSPKLNGNNQYATLQWAIFITGENCLCGRLRHICTQKSLHACTFCSAQHMSHWVEVWWNTLIWFIEFRLYQPYEVAETPGANSSQSNKL